MQFGSILFVLSCLLTTVELSPYLWRRSEDSGESNGDEQDGGDVERLARAQQTYLGWGYSKDTWSAYYNGKKIDGASASSFNSIGDGYAKDTWNAYYDGRKINGASASSFKSIGNGYAKDTWNTYRYGQKI